jgi:hypothetical protein
MKLRKMYLVSPDTFHHRSPTSKPRKTKTKFPKHKKKRNFFDEWVGFREKMREENAMEKIQVKTIAEFLKKVLPDATSRATLLNQVLPVKHKSGMQTDNRVNVKATPPSPQDVIYEAGPSTSYATTEKATESEDDIDEEVGSFGKRRFGRASPYVYDKGFLDEQYGLRKEDLNLMKGISIVTVDKDGDLNINGKQFTGTSGLWELLTRKRINRDKVTAKDLKTYKSTLEMTHPHLEGYKPGGNIQISRGPKYKEIVAKLFPQSRRRGVELAIRRKWITY